MDEFTEQAKDWLDNRFRVYDELPYQPHSGNTEFGQGRHGFLYNLGMTSRIAMALSRLEFHSLLDVGSADGFNAACMQRLFNCTTVASDLSSEALCRAQERYGLDAVGIDSHILPFKSNSFDVVMCNETIEHVHDPVQAMLELYRVAKKYVLISTIEYEQKAFLRRSQIRRLNPDYVHAHRTLFTHTDFEQLFPGCELMPQLQDVDWVSPFEISDEGLSLDDAKQKVTIMSGPRGFGYRKYGVLAVVKKNGARLGDARKFSQKEIVDALFEPIPGPSAGTQQIKPELMERLACPSCVSSDGLTLVNDGNEMVCESCNRTYRVLANAPLLYPQTTHSLAEIPPQDFDDRYSGLNRVRVLALQTELLTLRRTSNKFERVALRLGRAMLNLALYPLAFIRFQLQRFQT